MAWLQSHIQVSRDQVPLIEHLFQSLGALSITLGDAANEPMLEPAPGETPTWQKTQVTALFSGDTDADNLRSIIDQTLVKTLSSQLQLEILEDQDWERVWLDRFKPMQFGSHLWVCPTHQKQPEDEDATVVILDPGLAFGTGTHATTALCLQWLEQTNLEAKKVIDFGSGSGILGIAALKLGASQVIAIDHDLQALTATRDNAEKNAVSNRLKSVHSDAVKDLEQAGADILIANILANILIQLSPQILSLLRPGAQIALSGILSDQVDEVLQAYQDRVDFHPPIMQDDWCLLQGALRD